MTVEIEKNEDGTFNVTIDGTLFYKSGSFGDAVGCVADELRNK